MGALDEAWRRFREAGLESERGVPDVLAVKARLLQEEAASAMGAERRRLQGQAAEAYAAAGVLSGARDHLLEAASLWRLAGDRESAAALAGSALAGLEHQQDAGGAAYGLAAARAETLLLLGRTERARAALGEALRIAPGARDDHAATLRRLRPLCQAAGIETDWLEPLRAPRVLHFASHMSLAAGVADLRRRVGEVLDAEAPGFACADLAAGPDIVVAEELIARGVELDLTLPAPPAAFRAASAARHGAEWAGRCDAVLAAATVRSVGEGAAAPDSLSVQLAAEIAMGEAAMRARRLEAEAVQLLVLDLDERGGGAAGGSGWARALWAGSGRRQTVILAEREGRAAPPVASPPAGARLMALLAVATDAAEAPRVADALRSAPAPAATPYWRDGVFHFAYAAAAGAGRAGAVVRAALGASARIAGHYGVIADAAFPGAYGPVVMGEAAARPDAILASTPPGAFLVNAPMAAAICAADADRRVEPVDELFALRA
jgi:tetratricopeptide (TPR) repeat protein